MMVREYKFNPVQLIDEVRKRPGLYSGQQVDREDKLDLWKQVGAALYDDWGDYNKAACYDRILTLQRKWRSLRDAYNREIRLRQADGPRRNRRVYVYFKKLAFLGKYDGEHSDNPEGEEGAVVADPISVPEPKPRPRVKKIRRKKRRRRSTTSEDDQQPEQPVEAPGGSGGSGDNDDSDKLFLLAFLPEMRCLPPNIKMWARTRIANVMQEAVTYHYENQPLPDAAEPQDIKPQC